MYKKLFLGLALLACIVFSFTVCFANDNDGMLKDAADGVRNAVGNAENAVEDAAKGVSNASKDATGDMENAANNGNKDMANNETNNNGEASDSNRTSATTDMNNGYAATRTATDTGATTFMGMTATAWTWLILGIAGIVIVALVWYYGMQVNSTNKYDDRD